MPGRGALLLLHVADHGLPDELRDRRRAGHHRRVPRHHGRREDEARKGLEDTGYPPRRRGGGPILRHGYRCKLPPSHWSTQSSRADDLLRKAYLFDNDEQFIVPGWQLDTSWILCTTSGGIAVLSALGLTISAFVLPPEDGYEFINDPVDV